MATTSPSSQVQFDSRKLSRRRFSRGSCLANSLWAFFASSRSADAFFQIGFVGVAVPFDLALAAILLLAPLVRHFLEEGRIDQPVELVDIHGVNAIVQPLAFGLKPLDRFLVLAAFVGVAGVKRVAHPFQHLVVELAAARAVR